METLYQRLGGAPGIARFIDDLVEAHSCNPAIMARFLPYRDTPERLAEIKQHFRAFVGAGTGGPETYAGRSMPDSHRGMNISAAEYMAAIDDILAVLDRHGADEQTKKDMLAIAFSMRGEIISR